MKPSKLLGIVGFSLLSSVASASWNVGDFLDGSNIATVQAVNATAWATTGTGSSLASACIHNYGSGGYGIVNSAETNPCSGEPGTGPHAADNSGQTDMFLLQFKVPVSLTQITIGWNGTDDYSRDSDISVLAYDKSGAPTVSGSNLSGLLSSGWKWIGDYANVGASNGSTPGGSATVSTSVYSSWWLVSAFNAAFDGNAATAGDLTKDYFKLLSVAGNTGQEQNNNRTPEPGSMALIAAGLFGIIALRRRQA